MPENPPSTDITIVLGVKPSALERFAASELRRYLSELYGLDAHISSTVTGDGPLFFIGSPDTNRNIRTTPVNWDQLSAQGHVLTTMQFEKRPAMIVGGGSPVATLWAVYELFEQLGVRYLLWGDVMPENPGGFRIPDINHIWEPVFPVRAFRGVNCLVFGPECWSLQEYRRVIGQLVKLKYNELWLSLFPYQPFVHYEFRGQEKTTAEFWFGWHYAIDSDTIGREHFGNATEFIHPEFQDAKTYEQKITTGKRYIGEILRFARESGMKTAILFSPTDPTQEFKDRFSQWTPPEMAGGKAMADRPEFGYVGVSTMGADPANTSFQNVLNPAMVELTQTIIQAHVNTYSEADSFVLHMPEHRASMSDLNECWRRLDQKYELSEIARLEELLATARSRSGRAERELGSDIESLYLFDQLFSECHILETTARPDATIILAHLTRELYPIVSRVLPAHFKVNVAPGTYTTVESAEALDTLAPFKNSPVKASFWMTLQGDSMSVMPQLPTRSVHQTLQAMEQYGLEGFMVRYWSLGDLVPSSAYLARASWDVIEPSTFYANHVATICGKDAVADVLRGFEAIDEATRYLAQRRPDGNWLIYGNPMPGLLEEHYHVQVADNPALAELREIYVHAVGHLRQGHARATANGKYYLDYFIARCMMGTHYLRLLQTIEKMAVAFRIGKDARRSGEPKTVMAQRTVVKRLAAESVEQARCAVSSLATVVRDDSDRGMLACTNTVLYKYAKARALVMEQEADRGFPMRGAGEFDD